MDRISKRAWCLAGLLVGAPMAHATSGVARDPAVKRHLDALGSVQSRVNQKATQLVTRMINRIGDSEHPVVTEQAIIPRIHSVLTTSDSEHEVHLDSGA
jgi:hypothetical protein